MFKQKISEEDLKEELKTVEDLEKKGHTGFMKDEEGIFIFNYMIKGVIKAACEVCMATGVIDKITAYKKWIDLLVFVNPRKLRFYTTEDLTTFLKDPDDSLSRSLRVMFRTGPRTTVMKSDLVKAGRYLTFTVDVLKNKKGLNRDSVEQILDYGKLVGIGQWRGSGGYGRFEIISFKPLVELP